MIIVHKSVVVLSILVFLLVFHYAPAAAAPDVKDVRLKYENMLLSLPGATGIYHNSDTQEIVVLVEGPEHSWAVPERLGGFPVTIRVVGRITPRDSGSAVAGVRSEDAAYSRTGTDRPVFGGISIGSANFPDSAGTLGMVVKGPKGKSYALSCAHVIALDEQAHFIKTGTPIWQPGGYDGGDSADVIGKLSRYIPIRFHGPANFADAAIGRLTVSGLRDEVLNVSSTGFYAVSGITTVHPGDPIRKSGRTTNVTYGTVASADATVRVYYTNTKWARFTDQIVTDGSFSSPGDSGSAVDENGRFVGLLFAGSDSVTIICKAKHIVGPLSITV